MSKEELDLALENAESLHMRTGKVIEASGTIPGNVLIRYGTNDDIFDVIMPDHKRKNTPAISGWIKIKLMDDGAHCVDKKILGIALGKEVPDAQWMRKVANWFGVAATIDENLILVYCNERGDVLSIEPACHMPDWVNEVEEYWKRARG